MIHIYYDETAEEPYECECCGMCYPEAFKVSVSVGGGPQSEVVWFKEFDGHLGGGRTETPLPETVLASILEMGLAELKVQASEGGRQKWLETFPRSTAAQSLEAWQAYQAGPGGPAQHFTKCIESVRSRIERIRFEETRGGIFMPYKERDQLIFLACWLAESGASGGGVQVVKENSNEIMSFE